MGCIGLYQQSLWLNTENNKMYFKLTRYQLPKPTFFWQAFLSTQVDLKNEDLKKKVNNTGYYVRSPLLVSLANRA